MAATTHNNSSHDEHDHKYTEPSLNSSNHILEEEDILNEELFTEIINDDDNDDLDPSISDIEHSKTPSNKHSYRDRKKSKSSTNLLSLISITKTIKNKEDKYIRQRRHSESSSESHSNDYHKNNSKKRTKLPILIPLNVNGKITKKHPNSNNNNSNNNNNKRSFKSPTPKSLTRSILSRYKQVKLQSKKKQNDDCKSNLGISGPVNVQHVIHVEWDDQRKAYKGIPDVWHSKIPQSFTVPTQELPVNFRDNRSISLTQSVLHRAKSISTTANIMNHQPINNGSNSPTKKLKTIDGTIPIDYLSCNDSLAMPVPGPRVFINKNKPIRMTNDILIPSTIDDNKIMSITEYLNKIGIDDLNKKRSILEIRSEFYTKMGFSTHDRLLNIPRHLQQLILTYLDIKSYLRLCITCSDLASFLDDPIIWKIQVLYKSKVQGTLHKTNFRLRHRVWKATYMSMIKIDKNPSYYDHVWNIIVAGDTASGQNRLVVSLGKHWRCKLTGLEPVISAVNGTYRFGVDFVIRRVIIRHQIIKLQVWDGGNVMADTSLLKSVNIFLILFDLTNKDSFERIQYTARSMITLLPNQNNKENKITLMMVGNTTNNPNNRVISYESAKRFANERGLMYIEANTDNDIQSVNNAFVNLAEECINLENEKKALKTSLSNQQNNNTNCLIQ